MTKYDTRRVFRTGETEPEDRARRPNSEEIREIVNQSVKQWQPEYDKVSRDDERW